MNKIILDTNFLLIPEQFKVDIFSEIEKMFAGSYELYIIDKTMDELDKIINTDSKNKVAANIGKQLVDMKGVKKIRSEEYVDDAIVKECLYDDSYIVATTDAGLKKRLKELNIKIIDLRQKKYLILKE